MGDTALEKTAEVLRHEIDQLHRQQREITERLRYPRGFRRGGISGAAPRSQGRRGFLLPADTNDVDDEAPAKRRIQNDVDDEPPAKRRLSSAVVKVSEDSLVDYLEEVQKIR